MLKYITATTQVLSRSNTDEFLMHMTEHLVNITSNHQNDVLWCECLGDNRCFAFPSILSASLQCEGWAQLWPILGWTLHPPDLSEPLRFVFSPRIEAMKWITHNWGKSLLNHPDLNPSPIFEGGHLPVKSPASGLFTQLFIQVQIKENIKAPRHWPLCWEFTEFPPQKASNAEMLPFHDVIMILI